MIYKFFENVKTVEELKRQYKTLAFKHHPDRGGKVEDMQRINAEYDELYKRVKNIHETADGKTYEKQNTERSLRYEKQRMCFSRPYEYLGL